MATPKKVAHAYQPATITFSGSRAFNAFLLTFLSIGLAIIFCFHAIWAIKVVNYDFYGSIFSNFIIGPGTLIANALLSVKFLTYLNEKLLDDVIDSDHKKYI